MPDVVSSETTPFPPTLTADGCRFWKPWLREDLGHDAKNRWYGFCPMHQEDLEGKTSGPSEALYDLWRGTWWCTGERNCNAPKKAGTLAGLVQYIDKVVHATF